MPRIDTVGNGHPPGGNVTQPIPLFEAVREFDCERVRLLLAGQVHTRDQLSEALLLAASGGSESVARLLLERGADPRASDGRALTVAAGSGALVLVRSLLEARRRWSQRMIKAALAEAEAGGHPVVAHLLELKIRGHLQLKMRGESDDRYLVNTAVETDRPEDLRALLAAHQDDNEFLGEALADAAQAGNLALLRICLECGAKVSHKGDIALTAAAAAGNTSIVRFLIERGARVSLHNDRALRCAAREGQLETLKVLVANGANPRAARDEAILSAASRGHLEVVAYLLGQGADPGATVSERTPPPTNSLVSLSVRELARKNGHEHVVALIDAFEARRQLAGQAQAAPQYSPLPGQRMRH